MAGFSIRRNSMKKRSADVAKDDYLSSGFSSSDEETPYNTRRKNKVRDSKSIKVLLRESNTFETSEDHIYTMDMHGKRTQNESVSDYLEETLVSNKRKKPRCQSRNAICARINREKKKAYVMSLEEEIQKLKDEKSAFVKKIEQQDTLLSNYKQELIQLKCLLGNNKHLTILVSKLSEVTGLPVTSSILSKVKSERCKEDEGETKPRVKSVPFGESHPIAGKDVVLGDNNYVLPELPDEALFSSLDEFALNEFETREFLPSEYSRPFESENDVGICVHVNQNRLSVEFCSLCNSRAASAW